MSARKTGFDLQKFLTRLRIWIVEILTFMVFVHWIWSSGLHELGLR